MRNPCKVALSVTRSLHVFVCANIWNDCTAFLCRFKRNLPRRTSYYEYCGLSSLDELMCPRHVPGSSTGLSGLEQFLMFRTVYTVYWTHISPDPFQLISCFATNTEAFCALRYWKTSSVCTFVQFFAYRLFNILWHAFIIPVPGGDIVFGVVYLFVCLSVPIGVL